MEVPKLENIEFEKEYVVKDEHTAKFLGSGDVDVLSTPAMILFMENTARLSVQDKLPEGLTTVGTHVDVRHLRPAPRGAKIRVKAKLIKQEGRKLIFEVEAYWNQELIGKGIHERYIVHREKFLNKVRKMIKAHGSKN